MHIFFFGGQFFFQRLPCDSIGPYAVAIDLTSFQLLNLFLISTDLCKLNRSFNTQSPASQPASSVNIGNISCLFVAGKATNKVLRKYLKNSSHSNSNSICQTREKI